MFTPEEIRLIVTTVVLSVAINIFWNGCKSIYKTLKSALAHK